MNMGINTEQAQEWLNETSAEAQEVIAVPSKVDEILLRLEAKLKEVPAIGNTLSELPLMIALVKAWVKKEYTEVSTKTIVCLVGAFIYLVKPVDLIPDFIPVVGLADDLAVLRLAAKTIEPELKAFSEWRAAQLSNLG